MITSYINKLQSNMFKFWKKRNSNRHQKKKDKYIPLEFNIKDQDEIFRKSDEEWIEMIKKLKPEYKNDNTLEIERKYYHFDQKKNLVKSVTIILKNGNTLLLNRKF